MDEKIMDENKFKGFMDILTTSIKKQNNEKAERNRQLSIDQLAEKYSYLDITNGEKLDLFQWNIRDILESIILEKKNYTSEQLEVLFNYNYLEKKIEYILYQLSGNSCISDKSRTVINAYFMDLEDKEVTWDRNQKFTYHLPLGTPKEWINLCRLIMKTLEDNPVEDSVTEYLLKRNDFLSKYRHKNTEETE